MCGVEEGSLKTCGVTNELAEGMVPLTVETLNPVRDVLVEWQRILEAIPPEISGSE